jgi:hypothetical protein
MAMNFERREVPWDHLGHVAPVPTRFTAFAQRGQSQLGPPAAPLSILLMALEGWPGDES